ncbi:hypothetical protein VNO80_07726 [Phaseolus coccineus]|uniref:Translation factor GUF1 homolog, mitochondrial n=1 Tax=Phaseolus coccineus TaxID=3886 RepID=A0AAN9RPZ4_PHACN
MLDFVGPVLDIIIRLWDCCAYVREYEENLSCLRDMASDLQGLWVDVTVKVQLAEAQHLRRLNEVNDWLDKVEAMQREVQAIQQRVAHVQETRRRCLANFPTSCRMGRIVTQKIGEIRKLIDKGHFDVVAQEMPYALVDEIPLEVTIGLESTFDELGACFDDDNMGIIGLLGMGGVGKTTLLKKFNNEFLPTKFYDAVIWVVVSKEADIGSVQQSIGDKLNIPVGKWGGKTINDRAIVLYNFLKRKKFVLLLDDLWERMDLLKLGIPLPDMENGSKVIFTTRSMEVCGNMEANRCIKVKCLAQKEAFELFREKVGEETLNSHPEIFPLAQILAQECQGLPLALITVGRSMARKTLPQWKRAARTLKIYPSRFSAFGSISFTQDPEMGYLSKASKTLRQSNYLSLLCSFDFNFNPLTNRITHERFSMRRELFCSQSRQYSTTTREKSTIDLSQYPPELVRNFSIIAHVDHGKSTLADRLLELTGTIKKGHGQPQYLDKLQVERERGITVKAQTATMFYKHSVNGDDCSDGKESPNFLLNLIDTPGHVDFSYEVSRSLAACQGVLLVVDAAQGVQAQTVANFYLAFESNLTIVPVINKIDQPTADPDRVKAQLKSMFDLDPNDALLTSAKTGEGLEQILPAVIERIPAPSGRSESPLRMLLLDSYYDEYKGVICHVAVVDGVLNKGDKISSSATGQSYEALDIGIMHPELTPTGILLTGQVGYVVSGMRSTKEARVGDTIYRTRTVVKPLPGFKPAKHMVFSGLYPADGSDFEALNHAIERLTCNDASVSITKETSTALGLGFRCGFLGLLHMDVFHQRLEQEYGAHVISTVPTVPYIFEFSDGSKLEVQNPASLPSNPKQKVTACWEPTVMATIIIPSEYVGPVITLVSERRGQQLEYSFIDSQRVFMKYRLPLREIVVDFYNELKSITSGYASFDYEDSDYQQADLVKLDILLNAQPVDAMATIVHNTKAYRVGRELTEKLKAVIDRQMFEITIQAAIGSKIIARETISAMRKNVLAKCYGGDVTRKRKLLEKQKEGKKRMKRVGSVDIPQEAFHQLLKTSRGSFENETCHITSCSIKVLQNAAEKNSASAG